jgi:hypothetical protein
VFVGGVSVKSELAGEHPDNEYGHEPEDHEQRQPERTARALRRRRCGIEVRPVGGLMRDQVVALEDLRLVLDLSLHAPGLSGGARGQTAYDQPP